MYTDTEITVKIYGGTLKEVTNRINVGVAYHPRFSSVVVYTFRRCRKVDEAQDGNAGF